VGKGHKPDPPGPPLGANHAESSRNLKTPEMNKATSGKITKECSKHLTYNSTMFFLALPPQKA